LPMATLAVYELELLSGYRGNFLFSTMLLRSHAVKLWK
jgi:hypothetical protein